MPKRLLLIKHIVVNEVLLGFKAPEAFERQRKEKKGLILVQMDLLLL